MRDAVQRAKARGFAQSLFGDWASGTEEKMGVDIHQTGNNGVASEVDESMVRGNGDIASDLGDAPASDENDRVDERRSSATVD
jgi:hypothetical protein